MNPATAKRTRHPRVRFEGDVLIRNARRDRLIRAHVRNLSSSGIAIATESPPETGEEIECRLYIGGERRTLRGRVAWVRKQPAGERHGAGAGIEFLDLAAPDRELLTEVVAGADDGAEAVDVWIDGMPHPLRMRGLVSSEELKLGFRMPRVREGAAVRVRFTHRGVTEERAGSVGAVKLLPGDAEAFSRLVLQVSTPRPDSDHGMLGALDDRTEIDRPVPQVSESVLVDLEALAPSAPAADHGRPERAARTEPDVERTVIVPRPVRTPAPLPPAAPSRALRAWQLGTVAALAAGVAIGVLLAGPAPTPPAAVAAPRAPFAVPAVAAPLPAARPAITIEPIERKPARRR